MHTQKMVPFGMLQRNLKVMFNFNPYPSREQIESVVKALVEKHPWLKEPGSSCGWYCWKFSLSFKMGNFRQMLHVAGCPVLSVSTDGRGKRRLKKLRRSETNFLPDMPDGEATSTLEEERRALLKEVKKKNSNNKFIDAAMASTCALRRKEIIDKDKGIFWHFQTLNASDIKNAIVHAALIAFHIFNVLN